MWPVAIFLMLVVAFYWGAFCITVIAWLKALIHLFGGNWAALWFNVGVSMLFWWYDKPRDLDSFMPFACFFIGLGALGTFVRWRKKQQVMQAVPVWTPPFEATGNTAPVIEVDYRRLSN